MNVRIGKVLALLLGIALVVGFLWSQRPHPLEAAAPSGDAAIAVRLTRASERAIFRPIEAVGTLRSRRQVTIASRIAAEVLSAPLDAGASVKAGELLVELESAGLGSLVEAAAAKVAMAENALAEAEREQERTRALFERQARTQQELDAATTRVSGAEAARAAAEGAHAVALAALEDARLLAPFDARVLRRTIEPGDLATPGRPLYELYDPNALRLEVELPERWLSAVEPGMRVEVHIDALGEAGVVEGTVEELVPSVDASTRTVLVKLALPELAGALPGMFGRARLAGSATPGLALPRSAVHRRGSLELVYTPSADRTRAHMRVVRTGRELPEGAVELLSGLDREALVIVTRDAALRDGAPIRVVDRPLDEPQSEE